MTTQLNNLEVVFAGDYRTEPYHALAKGIKKGNAGALMRSALLLAPLVPNDSALIPVPSHTGGATVTLELCRLIRDILSREGHTVNILDCLKGRRRKSFCKTKKRGLTMSERDFGFALRKEVTVPEKSTLLLVDNVVATGTTARYAAKALGRQTAVLTVAYDNLKTT